MKAVLDFSAFINDKRDFVVKELSVIDVDSRCVQHWIFKSPKGTASLQCDCFETRHNNWLTRHYHGLDTHMGSTEYEALYEALDYICSRAQVLYAATTEKARALEEILHGRRAVISLQTLGCPPLSQDILQEGQQHQCLMHYAYASGFNCTLENVHALAKWCADNPQAVDMNKAENRVKTFRSSWKCDTPSPKELADQGFVQCATSGDCTKCLYCGLVLYRWEEGDSAARDHELNSSNCKLIQYLRDCKEEEVKRRNTARTLFGTEAGVDTVDAFPKDHNLEAACRS